MQARSPLREAQSRGLPSEPAQVHVYPSGGSSNLRGALERGRVAVGSFPKNRLLIHLTDTGKEGDVGSRSRAQSLTKIPFLVTSQLGTKEGYLVKQGRIVKVRKTYSLLPLCDHPQKLKTMWS